MYGGMTVQGVKYVWDYANDEPVKASEMKVGSDRWNASEKAKWEAARQPTPPPSPAQP